MPRNPRQAVKDRIENSVKQCEKIMESLMFLGDVVYTDYPDIQKQYQTIWAFFNQGKELLEQLRVTY